MCKLSKLEMEKMKQISAQKPFSSPKCKKDLSFFKRIMLKDQTVNKIASVLKQRENDLKLSTLVKRVNNQMVWLQMVSALRSILSPGPM